MKSNKKIVNFLKYISINEGFGLNNKNTVKLQGSFFHSNFKENLSFPSSRGLDMMEYPFLRLAIYIGNNIFSVFFISFLLMKVFVIS